MNRPENKLSFFQEVENIPANIYYHYTSLDALFNIVNSKTFRLTSLRSSNDKKELFYNIERFLADLNTVCEHEKDENTKRCFRRLIMSVENNRAKFDKECKARHTPYALCLSKKRDNLTHWDRYATNCTGVCIGFNIAAFDVLYRRTGNYIFGTGLFDIEETLYTQEMILQCIRNMTVRLINVLGESTKAHPRINPITIIDNGGFVYMIAVYQRVMKFAKNSSFVDEDEIRLYYETEAIQGTLKLINSMAKDLDKAGEINFEKLFLDFVKNLGIEEEQFMMSRAGIRSYHNLCLEEIWGSGLIPEILLGPMCVQNRKELDRFLRSNGLGDTKVSVSKVPIR